MTVILLSPSAIRRGGRVPVFSAMFDIAQTSRLCWAQSFSLGQLAKQAVLGTAARKSRSRRQAQCSIKEERMKIDIERFGLNQIQVEPKKLS